MLNQKLEIWKKCIKTYSPHSFCLLLVFPRLIYLLYCCRFLGRFNISVGFCSTVFLLFIEMMHCRAKNSNAKFALKLLKLLSSIRNTQRNEEKEDKFFVIDKLISFSYFQPTEFIHYSPILTHIQCLSCCAISYNRDEHITVDGHTFFHMHSRVPCHIVHLSSASALPMIRKAREEGVPLTIETTHHYLSLLAENVPDGATQFKCCPPVRDANNQVYRTII